MRGPQRTRPASQPSVDPQIFLDPLGYLRTEFYCQRVNCNTLEAMATSGANGDVRADAERVLDFIVREMPLHIADMEESLLPLLGQRVEPADGFDGGLAQYRSDRGCVSKPLDRLVVILRRVAEGAAPPADLQPHADVIVERRRRDLSWENDVILPLAEKRITGVDLATLSTSMADRRGAPHPK